MPTDAILPVSTGSSRPALAPAPSVDNPGALLDRDAFLTLLVTQLKYQDPSNPADTSQLLTQSAQLTMVDRLNEIADSMSESSAIDRMTLAGTLIGRDVTFRADDGTTRTERVESIRFQAGEMIVRAGAYAVPLGAIVELSAAPVAPPLTTGPAPVVGASGV